MALDTNVFNNPDFLKWILKRRVKACISAVGYMELAYHMLRKKYSMERLESMVDEIGIDIIPFDRQMAFLSAQKAILQKNFFENARDYAIGAVAMKEKIPFITNNKKHFKWLGDVWTPKEFMKVYKD